MLIKRILYIFLFFVLFIILGIIVTKIAVSSSDLSRVDKECQERIISMARFAIDDMPEQLFTIQYKILDIENFGTGCTYNKVRVEAYTIWARPLKTIYL